jgi:hypothetical protein
MIATHRPVRAASFARTDLLSVTNPGLRTRSSGGYPVVDSSGNATMSHPAAAAASYADTILE